MGQTSRAEDVSELGVEVAPALIKSLAASVCPASVASSSALLAICCLMQGSYASNKSLIQAVKPLDAAKATGERLLASLLRSRACAAGCCSSLESTAA